MDSNQRSPAYEAGGMTTSLTRNKNWRLQGVTIPFFGSDSAVCVHEHFEAKTWWRW